MNKWLITFRSVTYAQKGESALKKAGLSCRMHKTPRALSARGCGYCLQVADKEVMASVMLLQEQGIAYEKTYMLASNGKPEERML